MIKPKKKRPSDTNQLAASILSDVIKANGKPVKAPKRQGKSKAR